MKNLTIITLLISSSIFSQSKDEIIKAKDDEIKALKERFQKEISDKDKKNKIEVDKLNNDNLVLKNIINESNTFFLREMFDETYNEKYFKTRDLSKIDDSDNFKISNALVNSISINSSLETKNLCSRVINFNINYLTLIQIRENILNKKYDEKNVQEALEKIKKLPEIDPESKLGITKQSIRDLL